MRAKEIAFRACEALCKTHNMQLLDDTISLKKLSLKRNERGHMSFYRVYAFEYNVDGDTRRVGELMLLGKTVLEHRFFSDVTLTKIHKIDDAANIAPKRSAQIIDLQQYKAQNDEKLQ